MTRPDLAPYNRDLIGALASRATIEVVGGVPWHLFGRGANGLQGEIGGWRGIGGFKVEQAPILRIPGIPSTAAVLMATTLGGKVWHRVRARRLHVIASANAYPDGVAAVLIAQLLQLPVVVRCRGPDIREAEQSTLALLQLGFAFRQASRVVVTCHALVEKVRAFGVPTQRIDVVPEGLDRNRFRPRDALAARRRTGLPERGRLILFVGNLSETSGWRSFITAANRLHVRMPDVAFIVVGEGPLEPLLKVVAENGSFIPVGLLAQDELAEYMAAVDLVCLPGVHYGLPSLLREVLASGRPVVVRRSGGVSEVMTHESFGCMVSREDPSTMCSAMESILAHEGQPACRATHTFFPTWEQSADRFLMVLQEAILADRG
ncbi:MAG: glycosyltransferase [Myxococcales bacterium]|nr:glycosyltransferase [Myxococcales bacterium]